jgi:indole-3-glycerol phosphate synthase
MSAPAPVTDIPDTLARILVTKRAEVEERRARTSLAEIERAAAHAPPPRPFVGALCDAVAEGRTGLIAEIKRKSPSGGSIREPFDPAAIARAYQAAGASCLSVLTDEPWFGTTPDDLRAARAACHLPVLRKDFMLDPWQVFEARAMGADCILLIMAALTDDVANELEEIARGLDMGVLLEAHDARELDRALGMDSRLVGINNRDLRTLKTDIATTERLAPLVPADKLPIAESGLRSHADVQRMAAAGARCLLVGEHLLREPDIEAATRALLGA